MKIIYNITKLRFLFILIISFSLVGCGNNQTTHSTTPRTVEEIQESGVVKIGVFGDKSPFGYIDKYGFYQGYDVYFGNRIAKDLGVKVEYIPINANNRTDYLINNNVDIILANFTVTPEREDLVDFALPYMKVALGVVSPDNNIITDISELDDKTLIVTKGTTAETYFENNYPQINLLKIDSYKDSFDALLKGQGDAYSTDNTELMAWSLENDNFTLGITDLGHMDTIAPAVQKGNTDLLNWLNSEIITLGEENFFHQNYEKTLKPIYENIISADDIVVESGKPLQ